MHVFLKQLQLSLLARFLAEDVIRLTIADAVFAGKVYYRDAAMVILDAHLFITRADNPPMVAIKSCGCAVEEFGNL